MEIKTEVYTAYSEGIELYTMMVKEKSSLLSLQRIHLVHLGELVGISAAQTDKYLECEVAAMEEGEEKDDYVE